MSTENLTFKASANSKLTQRQLDVIALTAEGLPMKTVGYILGIHPSTVRAHLTRLRQHYYARNTMHAVAQAVAHGDIEQITPTRTSAVKSTAFAIAVLAGFTCLASTSFTLDIDNDLVRTAQRSVRISRSNRNTTRDGPDLIFV